MYDTGAPDFCLDYKFIQKNQLVFDQIFDTEVSGIGSKLETVNFTNNKIYYKIGNVYGFSRRTYILDLKGVMGTQIDGILGIKSFIKSPHKIDFIKKKITLNSKTKNFDSIKFTVVNDKILVPLNYTINQRQYSGKFVLDLGSTVTTLNSFNDISNIRGSKYISAGGIGGESDGQTIIIENFNVGKHSIINFPLDLSSDDAGALADNSFDGLLGTDILDDFSIIIDLQREMLYVSPNINYNKHKQKKFKSFSYLDNTAADESWIVNYLYLDTDAYRKGLRLNDKIIEIDGEKVINLSRVKFYKSLKLNQKIDLKILRGQNVVNINIILNKFLGAN